MALHIDAAETASRVLLALAAVIWVLMIAALSRRASGNPRKLRGPTGLAAAAATAVLGTRVVDLGWTTAAIVLVAIAAGGWASLTPGTYRRLSKRVGGEAFLVTVASEGIAALAAAIALKERVVWLAAASVVVAAVGVALYPFVLARFDLRNLRRGEGEHWVAGGSLAICSLAFAEIASAAGRISSLHSSVRLWRDIALALWVLAMLWLPILIACELRWPRWRYSDSRWVTVFPLGMYAVCSFQLASATSTAGIADFARIWTWVAVAAWLAVSAGLIHRIGPRELRPRLAARS